MQIERKPEIFSELDTLSANFSDLAICLSVNVLSNKVETWHRGVID